MALINQGGKLLLRDGKLGTGQGCCCNKCSGPCDGENPCPEGCECVDGQCQESPCSGPCDGENPCPPGCECVNGQCVTAGACCIDGVCDATKTSQSECESYGGAWLADKTCNDSPCQGSCCCVDGVITTTSASEEECEDCGTSPPSCFEWIFYEDAETPCPSGWFGGSGYCDRSPQVDDCSECVPTLEGASAYCYPGEQGTCGTWYPECAVAVKYIAYINYTIDYSYECGGAVYFGPNGTCPFYLWPPAECLSNLHESVGLFDTLEECQEFYDNAIETQPPELYPGPLSPAQTCDWPPAVGSGCIGACVDTSNPLP